MAHFYGGVHGNRGQATRLGTAGSGMNTFAQGWDLGATVRVFVDKDGKDRVSVWLTGGTNKSTCDRYLGSFTQEDLKTMEP